MRTLNTFFTFLIGIFLILQSCGETKIQQKNEKIQQLSNLLSEKKPVLIPGINDLLFVSVPGENGLKQPNVLSGEKCETIGFNVLTEVTPGISFLPQTIEQKIAGDQPVKSKAPVFTQVSKSKLSAANTTLFEPPTVTLVPGELEMSMDSLALFDKKALESGLVTFQHEDSIFPPIRIFAQQPKHFAALPFRYKENALFDLSFLDADQELPNSYVRVITEDKNGTMWFGTHTGGLISYNGSFFNQYTMQCGLSSDMILSLIKDRNDHFWIGTHGGGADYFDGKKITRYTKRQGMPSNTILALMEDHIGNIWFGTTNGVSRFDGATLVTYTTNQGLAGNNVVSVFEDNNNNIWFGTNKGATRFDGTSFVTFTSADGLASDYILTIAQDHLGNIWFGTNGGGVSKFDGVTCTNYNTDQGLGGNAILSIIEDHDDDNLWFGTFGNGVTRFNGTTFSSYNSGQGLNDDYVRTLFEDDQGNLWIGTDGGGVSHFNFNSFVHFTKEQGLSDNLVLSIFQDKETRFWFSVFGDGLLILNDSNPPSKNSTFLHIYSKQGLVHDIVTSMIEDSNRDFWFATFGGGVSKLDGENFKSGLITFTNYSTEQGLPNDIVRAVIQDKKGDIWFGSEEGATKFDGHKFYTLNQKNGLGSSKVLSICEDKTGALWFGTMDGGVSRLFQDTLVNFTTEQGLANNTVWTIIQDHQGMMWFGTDGGGVSAFNGQSFRTITTEEGLGNNYVFSLSCDNNNSIWAGTIKGLTQIVVPDSLSSNNEHFINDTFVMQNYTKMDGLIGVDFYTNAVFHDQNNRMWWGTDKALSMLDLKTYKFSKNAPNAQLNAILLNDKSYVFDELKSNTSEYSQSEIRFGEVLPFSNLPTDLSLPSYINHLTFQFCAADWGAPHQVQYQYKLIGFDDEWSLLGKENVADYRNITPGHYTFLLRATGKAGVWSETIKYPFVIRWPWYLSWWSVVMYILVFILGIWLIIKWRVSIIQKQKTVLEGMVRHRTNELKNAVQLAEQATNAKSQFLATISHEIRTPLNAVVGLTHLALNTPLTEKQEDYLQKIDRSAATLLGLINDILDFSKIEADKMQLEKTGFDLEIVLSSIMTLNAQNANEKDLEFVINIARDVPRKLIGDPLRIGQVLTNLCNNAIKFTSTGEVVIQVDLGEKISKTECYLQVSVKDTGIGISEEHIPLLFDEFIQADNSITRKFGGTGLGLSISKLLIEMMDGRIWLESEPGVGSTFYFTCKVGVQPGNTFPCQSVPEALKQLDILVCDDNHSALKSLVDILNSFSLKVITATSGEEVLNIIKKKPVDLLLIDMHLTGMSGLDTIIAIKENPHFSQMKSILVAGTEKSKKNFEQTISNIDGYLSKPFIPSVVIEKIGAVVGLLKVCTESQTEKSSILENAIKKLAKSRVLLAEDNEINQQVVFELLENIGVNVHLADNGAIAIQKALKMHFDLILMDLHMPVMDGYKASIQIRKHDKQVPIIAITADATSSTRKKCDESGINDIITKPIDPDSFFIQLLKWISPGNDPELKTIPFSDISGSYFPGIPIGDLDARSGIRRFGNNEGLYLKMLKKFVSSNKQTCAHLRQLIGQGNFEQAHLMIHTLKGESGNIAANHVYKQSQLVEQAVLTKDLNLLEKEMNLLENKLMTISKSLEDHFQKTSASREKAEKMSKETILLLMGYLREKNPKALDLLDELASNGMSRAHLDTINAAVTNEHLEEAIILLRNLSEEL